MSGTAIQQFNDFMANTGPIYLSGPDVIVNEAVERRYVWGEMIRGKATALQGGSEIRDTLMLDDSSTFEYIKPNVTLNYRNPQVSVEVSSDWRFANDHMAWTDQEVELNAGSDLNVASRAAAYKRIRRLKEQRLATSLANGLEKSIFRPAIGNQAEMETNSGLLPLSIPAFIHENLTSTTDGYRGALPIGWSGTLTGITVADEPKFTNQHVFYGSNLESTPNAAPTGVVFDPNTVNGGSSGITHDVYGLFSAFDEMFMRLQYVPPATMSEYFENDTIRQQMILSSRKGMNLYKRLLRTSNDRLVGSGSPQDPDYTSPTFSGIPIKYVSRLDVEKIYPRHTTAGTDVANTLGGRNGVTSANISSVVGGAEDDIDTIDKGPRFYFVNCEYMHPYVHTSRYLKRHDVMRHPNQPYTSIQNVDCWWNIMARSRQRQGIISPVRTA